MKADNLAGLVFGYWLVLYQDNERGKHGEVYWVCKCECGFKKRVTANSLRNGSSTKCYSCKNRLHGMETSPTYGSWVAMRQRCSNPKNVSYKDYGGKGIEVCGRWSEFVNFLADMGVRPEGMTIDRINSAKGYSKENCKWSTPKEQARNRGNTKKYQHDGKEYALGELADMYGIPVRRVAQRLNAGWELNRALKTPVHKR